MKKEDEECCVFEPIQALTFIIITTSTLEKSLNGWKKPFLPISFLDYAFVSDFSPDTVHIYSIDIRAYFY